MERAAQRRLSGVRLVQAAYHNRSLSLYAKLGFTIREPLALMQGTPLQATIPGYAVRQATAGDLAACNQVCTHIHGHDRSGELLDAITQATATVVEHDGRITGYAMPVGFLAHAVGESNEALKALIGAASAYVEPGFLLPTRNTALFRWCLEQGGYYHPTPDPNMLCTTYSGLGDNSPHGLTCSTTSTERWARTWKRRLSPGSVRFIACRS